MLIETSLLSFMIPPEIHQRMAEKLRSDRGIQSLIAEVRTGIINGMKYDDTIALL